MEELIKYGKKIVVGNLTHSHFGNVSKRVGDRLLDASHVAVVERNQLRKVLEGVRQLGTGSDREQLTREVVLLAKRVVNADRVVLALVNRLGDLTEREQLGERGPEEYAWRFLAEQARRRGESILSGGDEAPGSSVSLVCDPQPDSSNRL